MLHLQVLQCSGWGENNSQKNRDVRHDTCLKKAGPCTGSYVTWAVLRRLSSRNNACNKRTYFCLSLAFWQFLNLNYNFYDSRDAVCGAPAPASVRESSSSELPGTGVLPLVLIVKWREVKLDPCEVPSHPMSNILSGHRVNWGPYTHQSQYRSCGILSVTAYVLP